MGVTMQRKYLLDTCFILGLINKNEKALQSFGNISVNTCFISVINRIELLGFAHANEQEEQSITFALSKIHCLRLSEDVENKTIELRKRHKIKLPDAIVLATSLVHDLELLTLDSKLAKLYQQETQ